MQNVIILIKILNTIALSSVRSESILQFSEHFQLIFDNSNVNKRQTNKPKKMANFFSANFSELSKFFSIL